MPFKSQAQRRKFAQMMVAGEISPETFEEWSRETGSAKLPERVTPGKTAKKKSAKKAARKGVKKTARKGVKKTARKGVKQRAKRRAKKA